MGSDYVRGLTSRPQASQTSRKSDPGRLKQQMEDISEGNPLTALHTLNEDKS